MARQGGKLPDLRGLEPKYQRGNLACSVHSLDCKPVLQANNFFFNSFRIAKCKGTRLNISLATRKGAIFRLLSFDGETSQSMSIGLLFHKHTKWERKDLTRGTGSLQNEYGNKADKSRLHITLSKVGGWKTASDYKRLLNYLWI